MASTAVAKGTPPASPHSNWSVAPLLPRKSPERRRLASGHKSTQSLNLPRSSTFSKLEELLSARDKDVQEVNSETTLPEASAQIKTTELIIPAPTKNDPIIVSPKPRRYTDIRALEAAQNIVDNNTPGAEAPRNDTVSEMNSSPRMTRVQDLQASGLAPRRHVRGARSLSPIRHERSESMLFSSAYLDAQKSVDRPRHTQNHDSHIAQGSPLNNVMSNFSSLQISHSASPTGSAKSPVNSALEPSDCSKAIHASLVCPNDDDLEAKLAKEQSSALASVDTEVEWSASVLRLAHRREFRQRHTTRNESSEVSPQLTRMRQSALHSIARLAPESPRAAFLQGVMYETGQAGTAIDRKQAFQHYKDASRAGYARADYRLGLQFERLGDMNMACQHYEHGAGADDSACLYRMALIMLRGQYGYAVDEVKGTNCIQLSAISADADAPQGAFTWALMLSGETNLPLSDKACRRDIREAVKYFEKAASLGMSAAQVRLAKAHEFNELDCPYSPLDSWHYYEVASQADHPEGDMGLSKWLLAGSDDSLIPKDEVKSFYHAALAASRGLASAEFALGYYFEVGIACTVDLDKAQQYYRRALEHGSDEARARIEGLSRSGTMTRKDHEANVQTRIHQRRATIKLNQKSATRQHLRAQSAALGDLRRPAHGASMSMSLGQSKGFPTIPDNNPASTTPGNTESAVRRLDVSPLPERRLHQSRQSLGQFPMADQSAEVLNSPGQATGPTYGTSSMAVHQRTPSRLPVILQDQSLNDMPATAQWPKMQPLESQTRHHQARASLSGSQHKGPSPAVEAWTQEASTHSPLGSPNLAPSEVHSVQESLTLSSPRPESSVSNILPYVRSHIRAESKNPSLHSQPSLSGSTTSTNNLPVASSQASSVSASNRPPGATTFEEMGIPMIKKQKEECVVM